MTTFHVILKNKAVGEQRSRGCKQQNKLGVANADVFVHGCVGHDVGYDEGGEHLEDEAIVGLFFAFVEMMSNFVCIAKAVLQA